MRNNKWGHMALAIRQLSGDGKVELGGADILNGGSGSDESGTGA